MGLFRFSEPENTDMSFFEHLDALRPRLVRSAAALVVFMVAAFLAKEVLMSVIMGPKSDWFPTNRLFAWLADAMGTDVLRINSRPLTLINTSMAGQFNLHIALAFYAALVLAVPYMLWELWGFIKPALTASEVRGSRLFVFCVSACFFAGISFGYFLLAPLSVNFLANYAVSDAISNMIDIDSYMSVVLNLSFACGVIFLLPVLVSLLSGMGLLTAAFMKRYRRHAVLVLAVASAIITPPDAVSMVLVLLPLYGLYELSISIAARGEKRYARSLAAVSE